MEGRWGEGREEERDGEKGRYQDSLVHIYMFGENSKRIR